MTDLSLYAKYSLVDYTRAVHDTIVGVDTSVIPPGLPVGTIMTVGGVFNTTPYRLPEREIIYYLSGNLANEPYNPSRFYKLLLPSCMLDDDTVAASPQYTITWPDEKDFAYNLWLDPVETAEKGEEIGDILGIDEQILGIAGYATGVSMIDFYPLNYNPAM